MDILRVTLVQDDLVWEDPDNNMRKFEKLLLPYRGKSDLLLLPELFSTGFTRNWRGLSEPMSGKTVSWLRKMSVELGGVVAGSIIIHEGNSVYNRFIWAEPEGTVKHYDKRNLFRCVGEHEVYTPGSSKSIISYAGWNIRPFICYDLRFPAWSANIAKEFDLALYVANWPAVRIHHWEFLLLARAIENQAYVIGVNRTGKDGNGYNYSGHSVAWDPKGRLLHRCGDTPETVTVTLSRQSQEEYRSRFPVWKDM